MSRSFVIQGCPTESIYIINNFTRDGLYQTNTNNCNKNQSNNKSNYEELYNNNSLGVTQYHQSAAGTCVYFKIETISLHHCFHIRIDKW